MQTNKIKKTIIWFLIFGQAALWPSLALAQVAAVIVSTPATPVYVSNSINPTVDTLILGSIATISGTNQGCANSEAAFAIVDAATQVGLSGLDIIGGGTTLQAQLLTKLGKVEGFIVCRQGVLDALEAVQTPDLITVQPKQTVVDSANAAIASLKTKEETIKGQLTVADEGIWKALLITILINTSKAVADQLVNKLVSNYKIANLKQYTDSVATLMYDNQFIRDNFPDTQGQMMARAILTNPTYRTQIQPGIFTQASNSLGFNPATLDVNDPNYYTKMAIAGGAQANPYYLQTAYVSGVDQSHANSIVTAQAHISQGNGYKAPVNCAGSLAQQKSIDQATKAASDLLDNRNALLTSLLQAQQLNPNSVNPNDIKKAQADVAAAEAAWQALPVTVAGNNSISNLGVNGGNNIEGDAAIIMCEAVSSPAVLVNQGINAVINNLGSNMAQYNNSNLPSFLSTISSIATQIGSSLVLGAISGNSVTVNENQAIGAGVTATTNAAIQTLNNNAQANLAKGIDFEASVNSSVTNGYSFNWTIVTGQIPTASYITITGPGIPNTTTGKLPLSGGYSVVSATTGNYLLTVYSATGQILTSATLNTTPSQVSYNNSSAGPAVAGAYASRLTDIRGPATTVSPRGTEQ